MKNKKLFWDNIFRILLCTVFLLLLVTSIGYETKGPNIKDFPKDNAKKMSNGNMNRDKSDNRYDITMGVILNANGKVEVIRKLPYIINTNKPFTITLDLQQFRPLRNKSISFHIDSVDCRIKLGSSTREVQKIKNINFNNNRGTQKKNNTSSINGAKGNKSFLDNYYKFTNKFIQENYKFSGGSGNFVMVDIPAEVENEDVDKLVIECEPIYDIEYGYLIQPFNIDYRINLLLREMKADLPILITCVVLIVLTVISFFVSMRGSLKGKDEMIKMFYIALSAFLVAMYTLTRISTVLYFFSGHRLFIHFTEYCTLMIITYPMLRLIKGRVSKKFDLPVNIAILVILFNIFFQLFNVFTGQKDFQHMLIYTHIILVATLLLVMTAVLTSSAKKYKDKRQLMVSISPLFLGGMYGLAKYYDNKGIYIFDDFSVFLLFSLFVQIHFLVIFYKKVQEDNARSKFFEEMASVDTMTRHKNRYSFEKHIKSIMKNPEPVTIITVDLNNLKYINDNMGHAYGDIAIKSVADFLSEYIDYADVYRTGGDEFIVIKKGKYTEDELQKLKDKKIVCDAPNNEKMEVFFAIGCEYYDPESYISLDEVMRNSDKKMYEDKQKNKIKLVCR